MNLPILPTFVLLATFFFLGLDFQNAVLRGYCCGGWAVSLSFCFVERVWPLAISDRCTPFEETMKKAYFNLTFLILIVVLISLFVYSGLEITETKTETMAWKSGRFILTDLTKVIGILLVLTLPTYVFLKKMYYSKSDKK